MSAATIRSTSEFATKARERVHTSLELAANRSPENALRIAGDLSTLSSEAGALGLSSIATLARQGAELARRLAGDPAALTPCVRTLRELRRAVEAMEKGLPPTDGTAARTRARGKVLLVDDSPVNADIVCSALERAAFDVRHAQDMEAAAIAVAQFSPDVVLADVYMPDSTPAELCARIRAAAGARSVHVLLFSGLGDEALSELVPQTRADGFVSKERGMDAVVEKVATVYRSIAG